MDSKPSVKLIRLPPELDELLEELEELEPPFEEEDELLDELLEELELLDELDEVLLLEPPQSPRGPPPPVWLLQVLIPIQLELFSHPQPLSVFSHIGQE